MKQFISLGIDEQRLIINNTAQKMGVSNAIVEKDFWVCYMLNYLFHDFSFRNNICFKGGTSLSKVNRLIDRFSEDIDIALDWQCLGYEKEEPYKERSNHQQDAFNKKLNKDTEQLLNEKWLPTMHTDLMKDIGSSFDLYIDKEELQTICFRYPQYFEDESILQVIRLEVGALAEPFPSQQSIVTPYIAEQYSSVFQDMETRLFSVSPLRTFFEKLLILHREANRTNGKYPLRYSRHFYDVYKMLKSDVKEQSLTNLDLLKNVIEFKKKFYPCNWANYNDIYNGNIKSVTDSNVLDIFHNDYNQMKTMIFGEIPHFLDIINTINEYTEILNKRIISRI
jgi:predicted nucleotidyltransferase component of viral defense system